MFDHSLPSIERFAAYLNGNLTEADMNTFSMEIENNSALQQMLEANSLIDDKIDSFSFEDLQLPEEIIGIEFDIPDVATVEPSRLVTLTPDSLGDMFLATSNEDDLSNFSDSKSDDCISSIEITNDESLNYNNNYNKFDESNDDIDSSIIDI